MISLRNLAGAFLAAIALAGASSLPAQVYEGRQLVEAKLVADTTTIVPGPQFTAGLLLKMQPGWHTYWQFPGDAGIPTEIKWNLPPGWEAGPIQWPIPLKLNEPGEIQIYGYQDEVLLMVSLTPPAKIAESAVKLAAGADWLVCEKICIPGHADVQLELPVGTQSTPANSDLFAKYQARLPKLLPSSAGRVVQWTRQANEFRMTIADPSLEKAPSVDFFPLPDDSTLIGHPRREQTSDGKVAFVIPIESADPSVQSLPGLLVVGDQAFMLAKPPGARPQGSGKTSAAASPATATAPSAAPSAANAAPAGLLTQLLIGFLGGLILNLMPCVLPVISLKIFGFIQHAGDSRARIFGNGLAFTAGIFGWFLGIGLLLIAMKAAGREINWAFQFTNPIFVIAMSAVVLVFALNLFGVFEITLPASAASGILGWTAREGYAGSFFQGVFATVLATPCTAPYLGTALGFAFAESAPVILLMFAAIALGMSAPYLLLTAQPAWLRFVPRPGPWMVRVKQLMGFLLLATLLFLLWVLGVQRGLEATMWVSAFLLALSVACWMYGSFLNAATAVSRRILVLGLIFALVIGSGAYFVGWKFAETKVATSATLTNDWVAFSPERLQSELAQGRSVFVDFTAAWCITCKFNEASVLESAPVKEAFARYEVVKMKADWTNADPVITKTLKQFGRVGVPLYVLYPAAAPDKPIVLPELLTQALVLDHLQSAGAKVAVAK
jgi:thiol:disulfide interchange protein DsbD